MQYRYFFFMAGMLLPLCGGLQAAQTGDDSGFQSRLSVSADWKIRKGLHLDGVYELRAEDFFSRIERHQVTLGMDWSPVRHLQVGAGGAFIGHYDADNKFKPRYRFYADLGGAVRTGAWKLSLKERLQLTCKAYDVNEFQQTANLLELKSRLKVAYKGFLRLEPYAFAELRHCLNAPSFSYTFDEADGTYSNYQFKGRHDAYLNRVRAALGLQWNLDARHGIDIKFLTDWRSERQIDTNAEGTRLKQFSREKDTVSSMAVGYLLSF